MTLLIDIERVVVPSEDVLHVLGWECRNLHRLSVLVATLENASNLSFIVASPGVNLVILTESECVIRSAKNLLKWGLFPRVLTESSWLLGYGANISLRFVLKAGDD